MDLDKIKIEINSVQDLLSIEKKQERRNELRHKLHILNLRSEIERMKEKLEKAKEQQL